MEQLGNFLISWAIRNPGWATESDPSWALRYRAAHAVARDLLADAAFTDIRLATYFQSPDGELIRAAVRRALPRGQRAECDLLVEAVEIAAGQAQRGRNAVAAGLSVAAFAGFVALLSQLINGN